MSKKIVKTVVYGLVSWWVMVGGTFIRKLDGNVSSYNSRTGSHRSTPSFVGLRRNTNFGLPGSGFTRRVVVWEVWFTFHGTVFCLSVSFALFFSFVRFKGVENFFCFR